MRLGRDLEETCNRVVRELLESYRDLLETCKRLARDLFETFNRLLINKKTRRKQEGFLQCQTPTFTVRLKVEV